MFRHRCRKQRPTPRWGHCAGVRNNDPPDTVVLLGKVTAPNIVLQPVHHLRSTGTFGAALTWKAPSTALHEAAHRHFGVITGFLTELLASCTVVWTLFTLSIETHVAGVTGHRTELIHAASIHTRLADLTKRSATWKDAGFTFMTTGDSTRPSAAGTQGQPFWSDSRPLGQNKSHAAMLHNRGSIRRRSIRYPPSQTQHQKYE